MPLPGGELGAIPARVAIRIGIDTGGTFTDVVVVDGERLFTTKLPSTPPDFEQAVLRGCEAGLALADRSDGTFTLIHSTTVGTNALLERKGAVTGLITTAGFRDVLEIGRQARPELYNLYCSRPEPLVPRERRLEISERINSAADVLIPLEDSEMEARLDELEALGIESLAICLLFSFLHPQHEARIATAARKRGWPVSVSHELLPEFREYERTSTTVANAYVAPAMAEYLSKLPAGTRIVQSNGGSFSTEAAIARPANTLLSGPAAGVIGALAVARQAFKRDDVRLITFDMGGTSTDVGLLDGAASVSHELELAGIPVRVPMMDIHTVGAGGGSIAWADPAGGLHVGPESAGARPGPACYGRGGERPTVSDANAFLGHLDPAHFLGGRMPLDLERAAASLRGLAEQLGEPIHAVARGILRLVNAAMVQALRVISVERGYDPRDFTLVSFGGAGGLHACALAAALDMRDVLIPVHPGVLSAFGCVSADRLRDRSRTIMATLDERSFPEVLALQSELTNEGRGALTEEGFSIGRQVFQTTLDARYRGQSYEISSPLETTLASTLAAFHAAHERRYGYAQPEAEVELVALRLRATGLTDAPSLPSWQAGTGPVELTAGTLARSRMPNGVTWNGPLRIVEAYSTTLVPSGWTVEVDTLGNLLLRPTQAD